MRKSKSKALKKEDLKKNGSISMTPFRIAKALNSKSHMKKLARKFSKTASPLVTRQILSLYDNKSKKQAMRIADLICKEAYVQYHLYSRGRESPVHSFIPNAEKVKFSPQVREIEQILMRELRIFTSKE